MIKHLALISLVVLTVSACAPRNVELQTDDTLSGTDKPLPSPCACMPVDYDAPAFDWAGRSNV